MKPSLFKDIYLIKDLQDNINRVTNFCKSYLTKHSNEIISNLVDDKIGYYIEFERFKILEDNNILVYYTLNHINYRFTTITETLLIDITRYKRNTLINEILDETNKN